MQVTFIVKLMTMMVDVLTSKGFEITNTDVTEANIEVLAFCKDGNEYDVSISTGDPDMCECLQITGTMRKWDWCVTSSQIVEALKGLTLGDRITVVANGGDEYDVGITKYYESEFNMKRVDKTALRAIALDILGGIIAL